MEPFVNVVGDVPGLEYNGIPRMAKMAARAELDIVIEPVDGR